MTVKDEVEKATPPMPENSRVSLTVYDQGHALVRDHRLLELRAGLNEITLEGIAARIDPASLNVTSLTDPRGTTVIESHFRHDPIGRDLLFTRFLHEQIEVVLEDGTTFTGELCGGRESPAPNRPFTGEQDIVLRLDNGQIVLVRQGRLRSIRVLGKPRILHTRPLLRLMLECDQTGMQQIELTYMTQGMNWSVDYNLVLPISARSAAHDVSTIHLNGWVTLTNHSGLAFENTQVRLVQQEAQPQPAEEGRPQAPGGSLLRRLNPPPPPPSRFGSEPPPEPQPHKDTPPPRLRYFALKRPISIESGEIRQFEFFTARELPVRSYALYDCNPRFEEYSTFPLKKQAEGFASIAELQHIVEFDAGAPSPDDLPSGTLRVYQEETPRRDSPDDAPPPVTLAGETRMDYDEDARALRLPLNRARDLSGRRVQKSYRPISRVIAEETFEITLTNRDPYYAAPVRVPERLFRWSDWEILSASHDYEQIDQATIEFRVSVPPMETVTISYIVRYIWPG
jgi:hypothetical protein